MRFPILTLVLQFALAVVACTNASADRKEVSAVSFANLSTCLTSPSTADCVVVVNKPMAIQDKTVSGGRVIKVVQNGRIDVAKGKTLHFAATSGLEAGSFQLFGGAGKVSGLRKVQPEWWGADNSGTRDSFTAFVTAIKALAKGGGVIIGSGTYLINSGNLEINGDNVHVKDCILKRTSALPGWLLRFATTRTTEGGGVTNCKFIGDPTVKAPNGGVAFGTAGTHKSNRFVADQVTTDGLAQYGVGIWDGDDWTVSNIAVLNHGSTHPQVPAPIGIGFFVYPKSRSSGGRLHNIRAEINPRSTITKSAAIKLQTHSELIATDITAVGGTESALSIDSVDGTISSVTVEPFDGRAGLAVGNYNPSHSFSGQKFIVSDVSINGMSQYGLVVGGGASGHYKLSGCTLKRIKGKSARYLQRSNMRDCVLEDWDFDSIVFDAMALGFEVNPLPSTNNSYSHIVTTGGTMQIEASNSVFKSCGARPRAGRSASAIIIRGNGNVIESMYSINSQTDGLVIDGQGNRIHDYKVTGAAGRSIWFKPGSYGNEVTSADVEVGKGVKDSGRSNRIYLRNEAPSR